MLPPAFATTGDEVAHPLHNERPTMPRADVARLDNEKMLCVERRLSEFRSAWRRARRSRTRKESRQLQKRKKLDPKRRNLSPSMISVEKSKAATRSGSEEKKGQRGADTAEMGVDLDDEEVAVLRAAVKAQNV